MTPDAEEFCREVHPRLVAALTVHSGSRTDAEDLAQEALARAVARWSKVRAMHHPRAWVFQVAYNLSRSRWRRLGAERRAIERADLPPEHAPDGLDPGERDLLAQAVADLPPRQRAAVAMRHLADLSTAETAVALGCKEATVRSLTAQGVASLRSSMGADASMGDTTGADYV